MRFMNDMNQFPKYGILVSILLSLSVFTFISISEVQAAENILVDVKNFQNTMIIEFKNGEENTSNIKTVKIWLGSDNSFKSFKSEPGWGGGKYSDGQLLVFTASNPLKPGESVKFGVITDKNASGINWKVLDENEVSLGSEMTVSQKISQESITVGEDAKMLEGIKETGQSLYGTKKFIPDKLRVDSNVRLAGNGFNPEQALQFYVDSILLKSVETDKQGNFMTTLHIPDTINPGTSEFIIKNEVGDLQSTSVNISEAKNRFLREVAQFEIVGVPAEIRLDETLSISGTGPPLTSIILTVSNEEGLAEKIRVIDVNTNGEWVFDEKVTSSEMLGTKKYYLKNGAHNILREIVIKSDKLLTISTSATRYNQGDNIIFTGEGVPNKDLTLYVKDPDEQIIHFDIMKVGSTGIIQYEFNTTNSFESGTYVLIAKQENESDAHLFGIGQYPTTQIVVLTDKTSYGGSGSSNVFLNVVGPPSTTLLLTIIDPSDNNKLSDHFTTNAAGEYRYELDATGFASGVYQAVVSKANIQDSAQFSLGVQGGSGDITLAPPKQSYAPGERITITGQTENDNALLTIKLIDPAETTVTQIQIFSDSSGSFSTSLLGIPVNPTLGDWKVSVQNLLEHTQNIITVSETSEISLELSIEKIQYNTGEIVTIKGTAPTTVSFVTISIIFNGDIIETLDSPVTGDGNFSLPWIIPSNLDYGLYTIELSDGISTTSTQIDIQ